MRPSISVSIVMSNAIVREGLNQIVRDLGFQIAVAVDHPSQIPAAQPFDIAITSEPAATRELRNRFPRARIILLADRLVPEQLGAALGSGADEVLLSDIGRDALSGAIRLMVQPAPFGQDLIAPAPPQEPASRGHKRRGAFNLTDRQVEVLTLLGTGASNVAIAGRLGLSEPTVKIHIRDITRKLGMENRTQAAVWAVTNGMTNGNSGAIRVSRAA